MKVFVAIFLLIAVVYSDNFSWRSCGNTEYITVRKVNVSPNPLTFPGQVSYDSEIEIKKPLKDVKMVLKIVRNTFLLDITLPCVKQIGSCTYNKMCSFIGDMTRENWGDIGTKIGNQILAKNPGIGNICNVGVQPSIIKSQGNFAVPELPSILKFVAAGDYTVRLEFSNPTNGAALACLEAKATLKRGGSIWGKRSRTN